jgi:hypothetical protein
MTGILMMSVGNSYGSLPANTVAPAVTGTATVGSTLTTTNGTWTGAPAPTFTYQWQRSGSNIGGATSSTYVIQAADAQNTLRCVVTATNTLGAVSANSNSTATIPLQIGQAYQGGFYAGQISVNANGVATHNLVIAPKATGSAINIALKTSNSATTGTDSLIDGPANSAAMNDSSHPAAEFCEGLSIGGYTDWYMPARNEWNTIYYFLKPTTNGNSTSVGSTAYAVSPQPISTNYTSGDPAQTSVAAFQSGGAETILFSGESATWVSTQNPSNTSQGQLIEPENGSMPFVSKSFLRCVRAIRRVAI